MVTRRSIYAELQDFVQLELREPLRKSTKNKKDHIRSIIMSVRETCAGQECANQCCGSGSVGSRSVGSICYWPPPQFRIRIP